MKTTRIRNSMWSVAGLLTLLSACASTPTTTTTTPPPAVQTPITMTDSTVIPVGGSPVLGDPMAPVTLVLFGSPTCAFCELTRPLLFALQDRHPNEVRIVWKSWVNQSSPEALNTALLEAYAQKGSEGFWTYYDRLTDEKVGLQNTVFDHDSSSEQRAAKLMELLATTADAVGLNGAEVRTAIQNNRYESQLAEDAELGKSLHVSGAPALFLNGTPMMGSPTPARLEEAFVRVRAATRDITPSTEIYARMVNDPVKLPDRGDGSGAAPPPEPYLDPDARYAVDVKDELQLGASDALVTVVWFSQLDSPGFRQSQWPAIKSLLDRFPTDLRVVLRHRPIPSMSSSKTLLLTMREVFQLKGGAALKDWIEGLAWHTIEAGDATTTAIERSLTRLRINVRTHRARMALPSETAWLDRPLPLPSPLIELGETTAFVNGIRMTGYTLGDAVQSRVEAEIARVRPIAATPEARAHLYDTILASGLHEAKVVLTETPASQVPQTPNAPLVLDVVTAMRPNLCSDAHSIVDELVKRYEGKVQVRWHETGVGGSRPDLRRDGQALLEAYAQQNWAGFWSLHSALCGTASEAGSGRPEGQLTELARTAKLDLDKLQTALANGTHRATLYTDAIAYERINTSDGMQDGPAFLVQDRLVRTRKIEDVAALIDRALTPAPAPKH